MKTSELPDRRYTPRIQNGEFYAVRNCVKDIVNIVAWKIVCEVNLKLINELEQYQNDIWNLEYCAKVISDREKKALNKRLIFEKLRAQKEYLNR
jgi:hypothetical protein